jgi:hypothetical protein
MNDHADNHAVERDLLDRYRAKRERALHDLADAQTRAERYGLAVQGLEAVLGIDDGTDDQEPVASPNPANPTINDGGTNDGPRGAAAVERFLSEHPGQGFSAPELAEGLLKRGWINPDVKDPVSTTRAAANRLRRNDDAYVFVGGRYSHAPSSNRPGMSGPNPFVLIEEGGET